jgi:Na+-translocating ferredoxin:NAD+ oxidoreductase RnfD subunit
MDEIEDYSESIHEQSNEHVHHVMHESGGKDKWVVYVALTTAIFAVLAAITGLLAGDHADEAMLAQMKSSDSWAFYQAKGIKADILSASNSMLLSLGKTPDTAAVNKLKREKKEQAEIMAKAKDYQKESDGHVVKHKIMARGVTMFQIAIAIGAISIITKKRILWIISMGFAVAGIVFLLQGLGLL